MDANGIEALLNQLQTIRERYGEEAFKNAATDVAKQFIGMGGKMETFAREAFKDTVDFDSLKTIPAPPSMDAGNPIISAIQQQMPGIKSQAQFNAFMAGFDALRLTMDAIFHGDEAKEADGHKALAAAFDVARKSTEVTVKLADIPEAAVSQAASEFKYPPRVFTEQSLQQDLLRELGEIKGIDDLARWYDANKPRLDRVVSQSLRNHLFDSIRQKRDLFARTEV